MLRRESADGVDPFNLARFVEAQEHEFARALAELRAGRKQAHWMWFIFPQLQGLGASPMSKRYAITGVEEARAYLQHPILGPRLQECASAVMAIKGVSANAIFGSPDDLKLRSSATLFAQVAPTGSVFEQLLVTFFDGAPDPVTLRLIRA